MTDRSADPPLFTVSASDYPYAPHYRVRNGIRRHYVDEGSGPPVVMVHGNPTWSYYYRRLVAALSPRFRCIVPDHVGCGLSDKPQPPTYDYSLRSRVDDLDDLLSTTDVRGPVDLIVHDWGGMIGLAWAARHPGRLRRLVVLNTAGFPQPTAKPFPMRLRIGRNMRIGEWLIRRCNVFCRHAASIGVKRRPLDPIVREHLLKPYGSWDDRIAVARFVQTIPLQPSDPGYDIVEGVARYVETLQNIPIRIIWGLQDFVFDQRFLAEWRRRVPHADVHEFADCGHYILEDAPDECRQLITEFLTP